MKLGKINSGVKVSLKKSIERSQNRKGKIKVKTGVEIRG
jgi:hypothetical protein